MDKRKPKGPIKQIVDPNAKKREQDRQSRMTEAQKIRERKEGRVSTLERKDSFIRREKKEDPSKAPKKTEPVRGRKEAPAGPMQLKSAAKMKKC